MTAFFSHLHPFYLDGRNFYSVLVKKKIFIKSEILVWSNENENEATENWYSLNCPHVGLKDGFHGLIHRPQESTDWEVPPYTNHFCLIGLQSVYWSFNV